MNNFKYLLLLGFFIINRIYGQQPVPQLTYNVLNINTPAAESRIDIAKNGDTVLVSKYAFQASNGQSHQFIEKTYKGTPFFMNGWYKGTIYFEDGSTTEGTIAYNMVNNLIYYSLGATSDAVEAKPIAFTINEITFSKIAAKYEKANTGYFIMIFGGTKVDLYKLPVCFYHPKTASAKVGYEAEGNEYEGSYDKTESYFLGFNNNIVELKTNKLIYRQFGEYQNALEKFGKENNVNPKIPNDIVKLVVHFSQLVEEFDK